MGKSGLRSLFYNAIVTVPRPRANHFSLAASIKMPDVAGSGCVRERENEIPLDTRYCYACTRCNCPDPWRSHAICIMHARKRGCATVRRFRNHSHDALAEWRVPVCEKGRRRWLFRVLLPFLFRYIHVYVFLFSYFFEHGIPSIQNSVILMRLV